MNYTEIFVALGIGCLIFGLSIYGFMKHRRALNLYILQNPKVEVNNYCLYPSIVYFVVTIGGIASLIYGIKKQDTQWVSLAAVLLPVFASEYLTITTKYKFYHTDKNFFASNEVVPNTNVKGFQLNKVAKRTGFVTVKRFSGKDVAICQQAYRWLTAKLDADAEEKARVKKEKKALKEAKKAK